MFCSVASLAKECFEIVETFQRLFRDLLFTSWLFSRIMKVKELEEILLNFQYAIWCLWERKLYQNSNFKRFSLARQGPGTELGGILYFPNHFLSLVLLLRSNTMVVKLVQNNSGHFPELCSNFSYDHIFSVYDFGLKILYAWWYRMIMTTNVKLNVSCF